MKKRILISLFLLTLFCAASISGQERNDFVSETIKFNNLKISVSKKEEFISAFFSPLLSKYGSVEFNEQSQTLFLKDTQSRVNFIKKFASILENSGLQRKDFFVKPGNDKKRVTEKIVVQVLTDHIGCDVGEEFAFAQFSLKRNLLIKIIENIRIQYKMVEIAFLVNGLELTGNRKRVELAKKIITLFDGTDLDRISNS